MATLLVSLALSRITAPKFVQHGLNSIRLAEEAASEQPRWEHSAQNDVIRQLRARVDRREITEEESVRLYRDRSHNGAPPDCRPWEGREYLVGSFSIADAALFYVEFWGADRLYMTLPSNCAAHYARMKARPAVQKVLQAEGFEA